MRSEAEQEEAEETRQAFIERLGEWYTAYNAVLHPLLETATLEATNNAMDEDVTLPAAFPLVSQTHTEVSDTDRAALPPVRDSLRKSEAWKVRFRL